MNVKRIWMMSLLLGVMTALMVYIVVFSKEPTTTASSVQVSTGADMETSSDMEVAEEEVTGKREFANPMVEISDGKRAISIKVTTSEEGLSGYIEPESKVDIIAYATIIDEKTTKKFKTASMIVENVKVLAAGKASQSIEEALHYETVTVEVTPEEGVILGLAAKDNDGFYLLLRNEEDSETGKKGHTERKELITEGGEG